MRFISYAQNFEDVMLYRALKHVEKGFYVDVGANDPIVDSVTKAFYERDWRGINIEPVLEWYDKLVDDRPEDVNLQLAVGARKKTLEFHEVVGTGLSTLDGEIARRHSNDHGYEVRQHSVALVRLTSILDRHGASDIHFLKIDVEGAERAVLKGLDFKKFRPWIVLVEAVLPQGGNSANVTQQISSYEEWESLLTTQGYHYVYFDGINRFYVSDEHAELDAALEVPPNNFDFFVRAREETLRRDCELADSRVGDLEALIHTNAASLDELTDTLSISRQELEHSQLQLTATEDGKRAVEISTVEKETKLQELLLRIQEKDASNQSNIFENRELSRRTQELETTIQGNDKRCEEILQRLQEKEASYQGSELKNHELLLRLQELDTSIQRQETSQQELLLQLQKKETEIQGFGRLEEERNRRIRELEASQVEGLNAVHEISNSLNVGEQKRREYSAQLTELRHRNDETQGLVREKETRLQELLLLLQEKESKFQCISGVENDHRRRIGKLEESLRTSRSSVREMKKSLSEHESQYRKYQTQTALLRRSNETVQSLEQEVNALQVGLESESERRKLTAAQLEASEKQVAVFDIELGELRDNYTMVRLRAEAADGRARDLLNRASEQETVTGKLRAEAEALKAESLAARMESTQQRESAHEWYVKIDQLERQYRLIRMSRSVRFTAPLRKIRLFFVACGAAWRRVIKQALLNVMLFSANKRIIRGPGLLSLVLFPRLKLRLLTLAATDPRIEAKRKRANSPVEGPNATISSKNPAHLGGNAEFISRRGEVLVGLQSSIANGASKERK